jgi:predicted DNA-binding transcriptional regulator YafY
VIVPGRFDYRRSAELQLRLKTCLDAMHRQKVVTLSYLSHRRAREGAAARRLRVHLLGLVHYKDGIYFIVDVVDGDLEPDRERRILLALDRMSELDVSEVGFELPADFDARAFFGDAFGIWREGSVQEVKLLVAPGGAPYVEGRILHPRQSVRPQTDGSLIVTFPTQGLREVADWVLSFGEHVEVIEPPELRMAVERRLRQALANYLG